MNSFMLIFFYVCFYLCRDLVFKVWASNICVKSFPNETINLLNIYLTICFCCNY